ncbi:MAG TPA: ATP-binding protein [Streptosporangiaceae bacterium]|nr:ATP-binding protein [Streptosporangiaceae bacterium]
MDDHELRRIVQLMRSAGSDTHHVEAKAAGGGIPKSVRETLSAFCNGTGGTIILGLDERAGFAPARGFDPVRDGLAGMCADDLQPPIRVAIDIMPFEGAQFVVADIPEIDPAAKPSYVKDRGEYQGSFIRGGDGDRKLTEYEVSLLRANRGQPRDDREPVGEASFADLDAEAVAALLRRVRRRQPRAFRDVSDDVALQRLGVLVPFEGRVVPSLSGLLTLGVYPQQFFPQLNITFVVLPSETKGVVPEDGPRFIDNRSLNGSIPEMVADTVDAAVRNMRVQGTVIGVGREDRYEYPVEALREAVVNALMHRDYGPYARGTQVQVEMYPDRLLVRNPGGLFGSVTDDDLGREGVSSSRNSVLAALLQEVRLPDSDRVVCENRGTGIPTMLEQLRRSGSATVRFVNTISRFTTVFTRLDTSPELRLVQRTPGEQPVPSGRATEILALFSDDRELRAADVIEATGLGRAMALRYLSRLVDSGHLAASAPKASRNRTYRRVR